MKITSTELSAVSYLLIFFGPLIAYQLAGRNESKRDQRAYDRERSARIESRHEDSERRLYEYQRQLLEALQDAVSELLLSTGAISAFQRKSLTDHGQYLEIPEELDKRAANSRIRFTPLKERVTDDGLREELDEVSHLLIRLSIFHVGKKDYDVEAEGEMLTKEVMDVLKRVTKVNEGIGVLLRENLKHQWMVESK